MQKKVTIKVDEQVYKGLRKIAGRHPVSRFIKSLVRPQVAGKSLEATYRRMAGEEAREKEATQWAEATLGDVADEAR
jgi:predicted CopG family antitoxin